MKESSLNPLFRCFRYSLTFLVLLRSFLPFLATMQNQALLPSASTSCQPQSVAALLPEEILDSIFAQFGYDFSTDAGESVRLERYSNLSNMSVIAEGWMKPARRLLFRTVKVETWEHLQEEVGEWAGKQVRELEIRTYGWPIVEAWEVASAVFKLLKRLPDLRRLRLFEMPFERFSSVDSTTMQSTVFLPQLDDLLLSGHHRSPHSIISDLLATSSISRLTVYVDMGLADPPPTPQHLDFRGNLRFLSTAREFYWTLVDRASLGGMEGLTELALEDSLAIPSSREAEFYRIVGPTLCTLSVYYDDVTPLADLLPILYRLTKLSIRSYTANPAPLLRCLPPSLSALRLHNDMQIGPSLARWTATPSVVPEGLKQIQIDYIYELETYQQLPPIPTLRTIYRPITPDHLQRLTPATVPFKTLEMWFDEYSLSRRSDVQAECQRLGVVFRQRVEYWDD